MKITPSTVLAWIIRSCYITILRVQEIRQIMKRYREGYIGFTEAEQTIRGLWLSAAERQRSVGARQQALEDSYRSALAWRS